MVTMGRCNGIFRYRNSQEPVRNASTGLYEEAQEEQDGWTEPCQCQIDRYAPAKQYVGTDGQTHSYTYNLYVMQPFNCDVLTIGTEVEITLENGKTDTFTVIGIDCQRRYIEIWG